MAEDPRHKLLYLFLLSLPRPRAKRRPLAAGPLLALGYAARFLCKPIVSLSHCLHGSSLAQTCLPSFAFLRAGCPQSAVFPASAPAAAGVFCLEDEKAEAEAFAFPLTFLPQLQTEPPPLPYAVSAQFWQMLDFYMAHLGDEMHCRCKLWFEILCPGRLKAAVRENDLC